MYKKYILLLFLFVSCSIYVQGVGIGQYSNEKEVLFQPGIEKTYKFYLFDSLKIHAALEGDLAQYATMNDPDPDGSQRNIEVTVKFPEYLEPGVHTLYVTAIQANSNKAAMGGIASVRTGIKVFALYPFKHPILNGMITNDLNINEKTNIGLSMINYGEEPITSAQGEIIIYDEYNQTVAVLTTESKSVGPYESQVLNAMLDGALYSLSAGPYTAVANVTYDGETINQTLEGKFRVGELNVKVVDTTTELIVNATNKYHITLESDWAGDIENVYAKITTPNGDIIKTPNIDLIKPGVGRKAAGELEAYIETKGLGIGSHDMDITVYYKDKTTTKRVTVNIIDGAPPKIEKPSMFNANTITITIIVVIAALIAAYFFILRRPGKDKTATYNTPRSNERRERQFSDNDIRPPTL